MTQALAGIGAALSLFLLLVLAVKRPFQPADRWLAAWFFAQFVFSVGILVALVAPPQAALVAALAGQFAIFAAGPAHYFYASTALRGRQPLALHTVAVVAFGVVSVLTLPLAARIRVEGGAMVADHTTPWLLLVPAIGLTLASSFPVAVLRLSRTRREELKDQIADLSACDPSWLQVWATSILALNISVLVASVTSVVAGWPVDVQVAVALTIQVAHLAYVGQRGLTRPAIFFAASVPTQRQAVNRRDAAEDYARLEALLEKEKPHRLPNLTAEILADQLGWGPQRLTQALRMGGETNFFDAINRARVREVQQLAQRPENARVSLLVLAHEAGFGSKTAFYDAFHRHAGCTPAAWRRRQTKDDTSEVLT